MLNKFTHNMKWSQIHRNLFWYLYFANKISLFLIYIIAGEDKFCNIAFKIIKKGI
mgnify:CR=1 FL=1